MSRNYNINRRFPKHWKTFTCFECQERRSVKDCSRHLYLNKKYSVPICDYCCDDMEIIEYEDLREDGYWEGLYE